MSQEPLISSTDISRKACTFKRIYPAQMRPTRYHILTVVLGVALVVCLFKFPLLSHVELFTSENTSHMRWSTRVLSLNFLITDISAPQVKFGGFFPIPGRPERKVFALRLSDEEILVIQYRDSRPVHQVIQTLIRSAETVASIPGLLMGKTLSRARSKLSLVCESGPADTVAGLLYAGASLDEADGEGKTPLMWSVIGGQYEITRILLRAGARTDLRDESGKTVYDFAEDYERADTITLLAEVEQSRSKGNASALVLMILCLLLPLLPPLAYLTDLERLSYWVVVTAHLLTTLVNSFWFPVSEGDSDPLVFLAATAVEIRGAYSGFYPRLLDGVYGFLGESFLLGGTLSVLAYSVASLFFLSLARRISPDRSWLLLLLAGLLPSSLVYFSLILREPWMLLVLMAGMLAWLWTLETNLPRYLLLWLALCGVLAVLHEALSAWLLLWVPLGLLGLRDTLKQIASKVLLVGVVGMVLVSSALVWRSSVEGDNFARRLVLLHKNELAQEGRASYRSPFNAETVGSALVTGPLAIAAYMLYPFPSQWSQPLDIYAFLEALWRSLLLCLGFLTYCRLSGEQRKVHGFLLMTFLSLESVWGIATQNWGTALRHHSLAYPVLVLLGGPFLLSLGEKVFHRLGTFQPPTGGVEAVPKSQKKESVEHPYHRPPRSHYLATYLAALLSLVASFISYRLSFQLLGVQGFAEFATSKRLLALGYPMLTHGLGFALAHHVARCTSSREESPRVYLVATSLLVFALVLPLQVFVELYPEQAAVLLLGHLQFQSLIAPLPLVLLGTGLSACFSYYLVGRLKLVWSSAVSFLASGAMPLAALWFIAENVERVLWGLGWGLTTLGMTGIVWLLLAGSGSWVRPVFHSLQLVRYAAPRLPGVLGLAVLTTLPVVLAAHGSSELFATGMLALGCSLLVIPQSLVGPMATVLLPQATVMSQGRQRSELRASAWRLFLGMTVLLLPLIVLAELLAEPLLNAWVGDGSGEQAAMFRWIIPAMLPYAYFECFKSILDGTERRALTTRIVTFALFAFLFTYLALTALGVLAAELPAFLCAFLVLGLLALTYTRSVLERPMDGEE